MKHKEHIASLADQAEYQRLKESFYQRMHPLAIHLDFTFESYNPYPMVHAPALHARLVRLGETLIEAITHLQKHYLSDPDLQKALPLPLHLKSILEKAENIAYKPGTMRPDTIFGEDGHIYVCEINARFPLNGMLTSQYLSNAFEQPVKNSTHLYSSPPPIKSILNHIQDRFAPSATLGWIHASETGSEAIFFLDKFTHTGGRVIKATPQDLLLQQDGIYTKNGQKLDQFILELDREELTLFEPAVLDHIIQHCPHINDVRTLILAHDKRVLSVLRNPALMGRYLPPEQVELLEAYIPETLNLTDDVSFNRVLEDKGAWVLKTISGGRGVGVMIGKDTQNEHWRRTLLQNREIYMAQAYIPPAIYEFMTEYQGTIAQKPMHLVGSLPCFDDTCFGPGMCRASSQRIVNLGDGKGDTIMMGSAIATSTMNTLLCHGFPEIQAHINQQIQTFPSQQERASAL